LDKNKVFPVEGVWNTSRGLLNDIQEIKAQLAANHNGEKRIEYWRRLAEYKIFPVKRESGNVASEEQYAAERKKIDDALVQITSDPKFVYKSDGTVDQTAYTQSDFYKDLVKYNVSLAHLLLNASSDMAVVQQLKIKIKEVYKNGENKLIVVAHSQGNEVLFSAIDDLRKDTSFLKDEDAVKKFDGLVGYMQMAPPSPRLVTTNSFEIRPSSSSLPRLTLCRVHGESSSCSLVVRSNLYIFEKNWGRRALHELRG
jgi:hypothetical protein